MLTPAYRVWAFFIVITGIGLPQGTMEWHTPFLFV